MTRILSAHPIFAAHPDCVGCNEKAASCGHPAAACRHECGAAIAQAYNGTRLN
jgi:hypothetical protein